MTEVTCVARSLVGSDWQRVRVLYDELSDYEGETFAKRAPTATNRLLDP
jgi:hypothetical protein